MSRIFPKISPNRIFPVPSPNRIFPVEGSSIPSQYSIAVDWDNDGSFAQDYDDITSRVMSATWTIGRDYASQLTGRSVAGLCTLVVKNFDNRFNSFNISSPISGKILPGRPVRIQMTLSGSTVTMFKGFLDSIEAQPETGIGGYIATLRAVGPLAWVSQRKVNVPMQSSIGTGDAIDDILDEIGWPSADRSIDTGETTLGRWFTGGKVDALNALVEIESDEMGFLRETKDGKIAFEGRHHRLENAHVTSQATFTDAAGAALYMNSIAQGDPLKEIYNLITASVHIYSVDVLGLLWSLQDPSQSRDIAPGSSRTWWAQLPNPLAATNAVGVDAWTTPVAVTDYTFNTASDGSGSDATASVSLSVSKFDTAMKITFTNNHASRIYATLLQARGTPLLEQIPAPIQAKDTTSQARYGERSYPIPAKHLPNTSVAQDYCNFVVSMYKDPIPVLQIAYLANSSTARLTEAVNRDISDRITIEADNRAALGIDQDFFVESITHTVRPGEHRVSYQCSPEFPFGGWWVLGVSALGTETRLAY